MKQRFYEVAEVFETFESKEFDQLNTAKNFAKTMQKKYDALGMDVIIFINELALTEPQKNYDLAVKHQSGETGFYIQKTIN